MQSNQNSINRLTKLKNYYSQILLDIQKDPNGHTYFEDFKLNEMNFENYSKEKIKLIYLEFKLQDYLVSLNGYLDYIQSSEKDNKSERVLENLRQDIENLREDKYSFEDSYNFYFFEFIICIENIYNLLKKSILDDLKILINKNENFDNFYTNLKELIYLVYKLENNLRYYKDHFDKKHYLIKFRFANDLILEKNNNYDLSENKFKQLYKLLVLKSFSFSKIFQNLENAKNSYFKNKDKQNSQFKLLKDINENFCQLIEIFISKKEAKIIDKLILNLSNTPKQLGSQSNLGLKAIEANKINDNSKFSKAIPMQAIDKDLINQIPIKLRNSLQISDEELNNFLIQNRIILSKEFLDLNNTKQIYLLKKLTLVWIINNINSIKIINSINNNIVPALVEDIYKNNNFFEEEYLKNNLWKGFLKCLNQSFFKNPILPKYKIQLALDSNFNLAIEEIEGGIMPQESINSFQLLIVNSNFINYFPKQIITLTQLQPLELANYMAKEKVFFPKRFYEVSLDEPFNYLKFSIFYWTQFNLDEIQKIQEIDCEFFPALINNLLSNYKLFKEEYLKNNLWKGFLKCLNQSFLENPILPKYEIHLSLDSNFKLAIKYISISKAIPMQAIEKDLVNKLPIQIKDISREDMKNIYNFLMQNNIQLSLNFFKQSNDNLLINYKYLILIWVTYNARVLNKFENYDKQLVPSLIDNMLSNYNLFKEEYLKNNLWQGFLKCLNKSFLENSILPKYKIHLSLDSNFQLAIESNNINSISKSKLDIQPQEIYDAVNNENNFDNLKRASQVENDDNLEFEFHQEDELIQDSKTQELKIKLNKLKFKVSNLNAGEFNKMVLNLIESLNDSNYEKILKSFNILNLIKFKILELEEKIKVKVYEIYSLASLEKDYNNFIIDLDISKFKTEILEEDLDLNNGIDDEKTDEIIIIEEKRKEITKSIENSIFEFNFQNQYNNDLISLFSSKILKVVKDVSNNGNIDRMGICKNLVLLEVIIEELNIKLNDELLAYIYLFYKNDKDSISRFVINYLENINSKIKNLNFSLNYDYALIKKKVLDLRFVDKFIQIANNELNLKILDFEQYSTDLEPFKKLFENNLTQQIINCENFDSNLSFNDSIYPYLMQFKNPFLKDLVNKLFYRFSNIDEKIYYDFEVYRLIYDIVSKKDFDFKKIKVNKKREYVKNKNKTENNTLIKDKRNFEIKVESTFYDENVDLFLEKSISTMTQIKNIFSFSKKNVDIHDLPEYNLIIEEIQNINFENQIFNQIFRNNLIYMIEKIQNISISDLRKLKFILELSNNFINSNIYQIIQEISEFNDKLKLKILLRTFLYLNILVDKSTPAEIEKIIQNKFLKALKTSISSLDKY